ncbi:MAG: apolipoprotein N-acyltransferase, partial [Acidimicrobiales bacterium]
MAIQCNEGVAGAGGRPATRLVRWGVRLVAAASGSTLALAFPESGFWWWPYVGLVPVLLLVAMAPDRREALWRCWSAGCGFFLVLHHWLLPQLSVFA